MGDDLFAPLEIQIYKTATDLYLALSGRLIRNSCLDLEKLLETYFSSRLDRFILNMANIGFADSAGLGMLVSQKVRCARERVQFLVLDPSPQIDQVLKVSRLDMVFPIVRGEDALRIRQELERPDNRVIPRDIGQLALGNMPEPSAAPLPLAQQAVQTPMHHTDVPQSHSDANVTEICRLAVERVRLGEYEQAVELYQQVLQLDAECMPALNNLALLYEKKPLWMPLAVQTWEKVFQLAQRANDAKHILRAQRRLTVLKTDPLNAIDRIAGDQETILS